MARASRRSGAEGVVVNRPESAAGRWQATESAEDTQRTASLAERGGDGKQDAPRFGGSGREPPSKTGSDLEPVPALTRLGEMLKAGPKATGGKPYQATGSIVEPVERAPTLADLGIDKKVSK